MQETGSDGRPEVTWETGRYVKEGRYTPIMPTLQRLRQEREKLRPAELRKKTLSLKVKTIKRNDARQEMIGEEKPLR